MAIVSLPQWVPYQPARMSVARYHALTRAGAFTEHDSVELLDGVVIEKMSKNPRHRIATRRCDLFLSDMVPNGWHVQNQEPITLANSEPEPEIAVVRGQLTDYADHHPGPRDIALIVEIADTTLVTDRFKGQLYAEAGIPSYWLVNLAEQMIEVMDEPVAEVNLSRYTRTRYFGIDASLPVVINSVQVGSVSVRDLLANTSSGNS